MTIGEKIRLLRRKKAMTQEELSKKAGLGHNAVSVFESGKTEMSPQSLKAISCALGVDPLELMDDREDCFFVKLDPLSYLPRRAHVEDAGYDLFSPKYDFIPARGSAIIDTGVHIQIPKGYAGLIVSKSGLNLRYGLTSDGLIDAGYTGSIRVKLYNNNDRAGYEIRPGDKISQIVFIQIAEPILLETDELEETERGDNGFGSTGR